MAEVLVKSMNELVKIPKKRGRKPKKKEEPTNDSSDQSGTIINPNSTTNVLDTNVTGEKVKKKRGRKPKNMVETDNSKKE